MCNSRHLLIRSSGLRRPFPSLSLVYKATRMSEMINLTLYHFIYGSERDIGMNETRTVYIYGCRKVSYFIY